MSYTRKLVPATTSLIAQMAKNGELDCCPDLPYNGYLIREYKPLVKGGPTEVLILDPTKQEGDNGVAWRRTVDDCMAYVDGLYEKGQGRLKVLR